MAATKAPKHRRNRSATKNARKTATETRTDNKSELEPGKAAEAISPASGSPDEVKVNAPDTQTATALNTPDPNLIRSPLPGERVGDTRVEQTGTANEGLKNMARVSGGQQEGRAPETGTKHDLSTFEGRRAAQREERERMYGLHKASVGRIVHYHDQRIGGHPKTPLAAIITSVEPDGDHVSLTVFLADKPPQQLRNVGYGEQPTVGAWSWPPKS